MQTNSGGENKKMAIEEEKLKVTIEADASSTESQAELAIAALKRVKKQYERINKELGFKLSREYTKNIEAAELGSLVDMQEKLKRTMDTITSALKNETLDQFDFDVDYSTIDAAESSVEDYDEAVKELNKSIDAHGVEAMAEADKKIFTELTADADKARLKIQAIKEKMDLQGFISKRDEDTLKRNIDSLQNNTRSLQILKEKYDQTKESIDKTAESMEKLDDVKEMSGLKQAIEEIKNALNGKEFSMDNFKNGIKKATLALIGVRSAISLISKSMSTYLGQNDELRAKLQGCYYALGSMFAPVLEFIINLFAKLLAIINAIAQGLGFAGINMKGLSKSAGAAAKKMKQLAGFDELNNLSSDSGGGGGAAASIKNPLEGIDQDAKWLQVIKDNATAIAALFAAIVAAIAAMKLGLSGIQSLGIGVVVFGIVDAILRIKKLIDGTDKSLKNIGKIVQDLGVVFGGLSIITGNWVLAAISGVVLLAGKFIENFDEIKAKASEVWTKISDWCHEHVDKIREYLAPLAVWNTDLWNNMWAGIKSTWSKFTTWLHDTLANAWNGILKIFSKDGGGFKGITDGITSTLKVYINRLISGVNSVIAVPFQGVQNMLSKLRSWSIAGMTPFRNLPWISIPRIPMLATGGFPEDGLFFANSGELVGKFANGNTAVVNNEQIIEGIKRGVIDAMTQVNSRNTDSSPDVVVNLDGYELARIISNKQRYLERVEGRAF